jgi:hypothetical protein
MYSIKSVDVRSCAKMAGALYGALALLVAPFGVVGVLVGLVNRDGATVGASLLLLAAPLLYGVLGFVVGAVAAWVYNRVAGDGRHRNRVGGNLAEFNFHNPTRFAIRHSHGRYAS